MNAFSNLLGAVALFFGLQTAPVGAADAVVLKDHVLGNPSAPITVVEFASFTCSHCADFYAKILPEIEKKYIDTGKVKFIFRDFPFDAISLKASTLVHCMPEAQFYPFTKILFTNFASWIKTPKPEETLLQYAQMAGLAPEKAKACMDDTKLMDAIIARRQEASDKYSITATPTFLINDGVEKIVGVRTIEDLSTIFDKLLAQQPQPKQSK